MTSDKVHMHDILGRLYCVDVSIKSVNSHPMLGTAYTLHLPSGDNLLLHKAIELAVLGNGPLRSRGSWQRPSAAPRMSVTP